jgi:quinohemoprotein ethanol dehydrogenase
VLDRADGKLISANNYVPVNWATGFDLKTGGRSRTRIRAITARASCGWARPARSARTTGTRWPSIPEGLVYIPAINSAFPFIHKPDWKANKHGFNVGLDLASGACLPMPRPVPGRLPQPRAN